MNPNSVVPRPGQSPSQWSQPSGRMPTPVSYNPGPQRTVLRRIAILVVVLIVGVLILGIFTLLANKRKAVDVQRRTDIAALSNGLRSYEQEYDVYPSFQQISDRAYTNAYMADVPAAAFVDPDGNPLAESGDKGYIYMPSPTGCDNKTKYCTAYVLKTRLNDKTELSREDVAE